MNIYRQFKQPGFQPARALSLGNWALCLSDLGQWEEAGIAIEQALRIISPNFLDQPLSFAQQMREMIEHYHEILKVIDGVPDEELVLPIEELLNTLDGSARSSDQT